jgi:hypothetical protein
VVIAMISRLRYSLAVMILGSIISLAFASRLAAQAQAPSANTSSSTSAPSDAVAKASERKKRFEEEEKRLENAEGAQTAPKSEPGRRLKTISRFPRR